MHQSPKQKYLFEKAAQFFPGGVNSPVRAFRAVGGCPIFARKGKGAHFWDEDTHKYLDFCGSWGALLFGHAPDGLVKTICKAAADGTSFGMVTAKEAELAQKIQKFFPSMEKMRFVSSGTESVLSAVRLARGFTKRGKIVKVDGGYHGHVDSLLIKAGSGGATFGVPDSAGIPEDLAKQTLSVPFNDIAALEAVFKKEGNQIAAFILEPVPANMGVVPPAAGYLESARRLTAESGALLIFDEVITGFRVSSGGAQKLFSIKPDLTCLGKIIGGGMPFAVFGGRREIMDQLSPLGGVYQAGTLSGNPVAVAAGLWVLNEIEKKNARLSQMNRDAKNFYDRLGGFIKSKSLGLRLNHLGSMFTLFFTPEPVTDYASAKKSDTKKFGAFFQHALEKGIYLAPSQFEANFISAAHSSKDLDRAFQVFTKALL